MQDALIIRSSRHGVWLHSTAASAAPNWLPFEIAGNKVSASERITQQIADAADQYARDERLHRGRVVICTGSEVSYFIRLDRRNLVGEVSHESLRYAVEAVLPVDAEAIEVDFLADENTISCVAIETDLIDPLVHALEQLGLQVQHVVCETLLCVQHALLQKQVASTSLLTIEGESPAEPSQATRANCDVVSLLNGRPVAWSLCASQAIAMQQELQLQSSRLPQDAQQVTIMLGRPEATIDAVLDLLRGRLKPWFAMRRGKLAAHDPFRTSRKSFSVFAALLTAAALIACGVLGWKAHQHTGRADDAVTLMQGVFKENFPGQRVPAAIVKRMESEHRKFIGQRNPVGNVPETIDASSVLLPLIASLPSNEDLPVEKGFVVESVRINDGEFLLNLRLSSYQDAGPISRSLEQAGFSVEPPSSTRSSAGRIQTQFRGTWSPQAKQVKP
ncbi:hypothetical protein [Planctomycetes bacterium K23_9]|uniref:GspL periplasmic domain protein n=1 Tax=Stieleria marina TaxID=1930275 RepID=A0A517NNX1_9BACT|nr:hypothetical protein K239x_07580 [Planctomycetes bacterium K23_9]